MGGEAEIKGESWEQNSSEEGEGGWAGAEARKELKSEAGELDGGWARH